MVKKILIIAASFLISGFIIVSIILSTKANYDVYIEEKQTEIKDDEGGLFDVVSVYVEGDVLLSGKRYVPKEWNVAEVLNSLKLKDGADLSSLDLNQQVYEGMVIRVGGKEDNKEDIEQIEDKIDINHATKEELMTLEGINEVLAERIISFRQTEPFKVIEDIMKVSGIKDGKFAKIKDFITVR